MTFRALVVVLAAFAPVLGYTATTARAAAESRPNVVYILADDLGYADVGFQGIAKDVKTPNIDKIAAAGVRFTNAYVSCPVCSPTRAGLMTGRYQQRFGHEFNPGPNAAENFGLPTDQVTMAQVLKDAGYATGAVGKWHLGFRPEMHPNRRGFDEFFGFLAGAHMYNGVGQGNNAVMRGDKPVESTEYLTDAFGKEAASFVDRMAGARAAAGASGKPFFLYLAFNAVHVPQQAPQKYLDRFPDVTDVKRKTMLAMLSAADDAVGQVMAALEKHKQVENTLVIFHTDNGGPTKGNGSLNTPLRGFKGDVWEGGVRIPFAMQWTGHLPAGKVYAQPVISLDMFPTALAAAGAETSKGVKFDGVNLLPHLDAKVAEPAPGPHDALYWRYGGKWAVREGNFKLLRADANSPVQLFDLGKDVGEQTDLASAEPERVKQMQKRFDEWNGQLEKPRWNDARNERKQAGDGKGGKAAKRKGKAGADGAGDSE
jgi:arylsulfatase A-like enzyme